MFGRRILILVPHPDDEIVACAAAIGHAQAAGSEIYTLYLTHGCIAKNTLWPWQRRYYERYILGRRSEADTAARFLGITPVGWSPRPARYLWRDLPSVAHDIRMTIEQYAIDQVWIPAYEGGNADHDGLNAVGQTLQTLVSVLEFAEYNFFQGKAHSQDFPYLTGDETTINLTPLEQKKKRMALDIYKSEKQNLNYVDVQHECYRPLTTYDYTKPPHPGTLWYARFQWVPFKHPRVDFTKAHEVCAAIASFLAA